MPHIFCYYLLYYRLLEVFCLAQTQNNAKLSENMMSYRARPIADLLHNANAKVSLSSHPCLIIRRMTLEINVQHLKIF